MLPFFDQDHMALRARVREWVGEKLFSPRDQNKTVEQSAVQLVADLASAGFLNYTVTQEFGGIRTAVQARDLCVLREELARGDALADTMFAMQALGSYPITFAGTVSQKQSYLAKVTSGAAIAAFAITEPDAGSDVASMQSRAVRQGSTFLLSGTKRFISNAGIANFYIVFASTQPDRNLQLMPIMRIMKMQTILNSKPIIISLAAITHTQIIPPVINRQKLTFEQLNLTTHYHLGKLRNLKPAQKVVL